MGIYIPGWNIPQDCEHCPCVTDYVDWCKATGNHLIRKKDMDKPVWCPIKEFPDSAPSVSMSLYDSEEIHENCTVQILHNSVTGEYSVGWWENGGMI